jgi:hypothetical protein
VKNEGRTLKSPATCDSDRVHSPGEYVYIRVIITHSRQVFPHSRQVSRYLKQQPQNGNKHGRTPSHCDIIKGNGMIQTLVRPDITGTNPHFGSSSIKSWYEDDCLLGFCAGWHRRSSLGGRHTVILVTTDNRNNERLIGHKQSQISHQQMILLNETA